MIIEQVQQFIMQEEVQVVLGVVAHPHPEEMAGAEMALTIKILLHQQQVQ
jgi:hypothetical protein